MLRGWLAVAIGLLTAIIVAAQTPEQEVRKALEAAAVASRNADKAAYAHFLADDLRWIRTDGGIDGKQQRLNELTPREIPAMSEIDVRIVRDVAIVTLKLTGQNGGTSRGARVLVKRDGRWQLLLHSQPPITAQ